MTGYDYKKQSAIQKQLRRLAAENRRARMEMQILTGICLILATVLGITLIMV